MKLHRLTDAAIGSCIYCTVVPHSRIALNVLELSGVIHTALTGFPAHVDLSALSWAAASTLCPLDIPTDVDQRFRARCERFRRRQRERGRPENASILSWERSQAVALAADLKLRERLEAAIEVLALGAL